MCCRQCQSWCVTRTHISSRIAGHCQLIKTVMMHTFLCCPIRPSSLLPQLSHSSVLPPFFSLSHVALPASPLKLHSVGPYVLHREPQMRDQWESSDLLLSEGISEAATRVIPCFPEHLPWLTMADRLRRKGSQKTSTREKPIMVWRRNILHCFIEDQSTAETREEVLRPREGESRK